jgi:hypothetical protein
VMQETPEIEPVNEKNEIEENDQNSLGKKS